MAFWHDPSALLPKQSHRWVIFLDQHIPEDQKGDTIPHYFAKSVDRPSYKVDTLQAKYLYAHTFNFPKRVVWNPIKIEFYDVRINEQNVGDKSSNTFDDFLIDPRISADYKEIVEKEASGVFQKSTQLFFYQFLQKCGYFVPNELERPDQLLRFRSYHFKKNMVGALNGQKVNLLKNNSDQYDKDYIVIKELDGNGETIEHWKIFNPIITEVSTGKLDYASDNIINITVGLTYDWAELVPRDAQQSSVEPLSELEELKKRSDEYEKSKPPSTRRTAMDDRSVPKEASISAGEMTLRNTTITTTYSAHEAGKEPNISITYTK